MKWTSHISLIQHVTNSASSWGLGSIPGTQFGYQLLIMFSPNSKAVVKYDGGEVTVIPSRSPCERDLYWRSEFEPKVRDVIHKQLTYGDVAIDIGAHVGHHTVSMHQAVGDSGRVISLEPDPDRAAVLRETVSQLEGVDALECGVSNSVGDGYLSGDIPEVSESGTPASFTTLDDIITDHGLGSVDVIKMDIEGHEVEALQGLDDTADRVQSLIIEVHTDMIKDSDIGDLTDTLDEFNTIRRIDSGELVSDLEGAIRDSPRSHLFCAR